MLRHATKSHSYSANEADFMSMALTYRFTQSQVEAMDRLTRALNKASHSSTWIGIGLVVVGIATVVMAVLSYMK